MFEKDYQLLNSLGEEGDYPFMGPFIGVGNLVHQTFKPRAQKDDRDR